MKNTLSSEELSSLKNKIKIHLVKNKLEEPNDAIERKSQSLNPQKWIPWFNAQNDFARDILEKIRASSISARILADKVIYTLGNGFHIEGKDVNKALNYFLEVNAEGESMQDIISKIAKDYYFLGNAFIEVVRIGNRINLNHLDASTILVAKPENNRKGFYFSRDWKNYMLPEFEPLFLPQYPNYQKIKGLEGERCIIHIRNYYPGYYYYGLPDYYAAYYSGWMNIDYHIPKFNENRFENQFRPSGMIVFTGKNLSEEDEKSMNDKIEKNWSGEANSSKLIVISVQDETLAPKYIPFNDAPEGAFRDLQRLATENIIAAHNWHPSLILQQPGKLSNSSEIQTAYELISSTYIIPNRNRILTPILKVLRNELKLSIDKLDVQTTSPVSLYSQIDPKQVLSSEEQRNILGYSEQF